ALLERPEDGIVETQLGEQLREAQLHAAEAVERVRRVEQGPEVPLREQAGASQRVPEGGGLRGGVVLEVEDPAAEVPASRRIAVEDQRVGLMERGAEEVGGDVQGAVPQQTPEEELGAADESEARRGVEPSRREVGREMGPVARGLLAQDRVGKGERAAVLDEWRSLD